MDVVRLFTPTMGRSFTPFAVPGVHFTNSNMKAAVKVESLSLTATFANQTIKRHRKSIRHIKAKQVHYKRRDSEYVTMRNLVREGMLPERSEEYVWRVSHHSVRRTEDGDAD